MAKLLTLALPTYNRREACIRTVNNFINQIVENGFQDDVELLISDNCSTDGTSVQLKILAEKYPDIIDYRRQDANLGMGGNFEYVINECHGEYICVLGDDDFYEENLLSSVLKVIKEKNPEFIFVNCYWPSGSCGVDLEEDYYGSFIGAMDLLKSSATFISPCIVKTEQLKKAPFDHHNWMVYEKTVNMENSELATAYIFKEPLIHNAKADEESDWQQNVEKSLLYLNELISFYIKEKDSNVLANNRLYLIELYSEMMLRVLGKNYRSGYWKFFKKYKKYKRIYRFFIILLLIGIILSGIFIYNHPAILERLLLKF